MDKIENNFDSWIELEPNYRDFWFGNGLHFPRTVTHDSILGFLRIRLWAALASGGWVANRSLRCRTKFNVGCGKKVLPSSRKISLLRNYVQFSLKSTPRGEEQHRNFTVKEKTTTNQQYLVLSNQTPSAPKTDI